MTASRLADAFPRPQAALHGQVDQVWSTFGYRHISISRVLQAERRRGCEVLSTKRPGALRPGYRKLHTSRRYGAPPPPTIRPPLRPSGTTARAQRGQEVIEDEPSIVLSSAELERIHAAKRAETERVEAILRKEIEVKQDALKARSDRLDWIRDQLLEQEIESKSFPLAIKATLAQAVRNGRRAYSLSKFEHWEQSRIIPCFQRLDEIETELSSAVKTLSEDVLQPQLDRVARELDDRYATLRFMEQKQLEYNHSWWSASQAVNAISELKAEDGSQRDVNTASSALRRSCEALVELINDLRDDFEAQPSSSPATINISPGSELSLWTSSAEVTVLEIIRSAHIWRLADTLSNIDERSPLTSADFIINYDRECLTSKSETLTTAMDRAVDILHRLDIISPAALRLPRRKLTIRQCLQTLSCIRYTQHQLRLEFDSLSRNGFAPIGLRNRAESDIRRGVILRPFNDVVMGTQNLSTELLDICNDLPESWLSIRTRAAVEKLVNFFKVHRRSLYQDIFATTSPITMDLAIGRHRDREYNFALAQLRSNPSYVAYRDTRLLQEQINKHPILQDNKSLTSESVAGHTFYPANNQIVVDVIFSVQSLYQILQDFRSAEVVGLCVSTPHDTSSIDTITLAIPGRIAVLLWSTLCPKGEVSEQAHHPLRSILSRADVLKVTRGNLDRTREALFMDKIDLQSAVELPNRPDQTGLDTSSNHHDHSRDPRSFLKAVARTAYDSLRTFLTIVGEPDSFDISQQRETSISESQSQLQNFDGEGYELGPLIVDLHSKRYKPFPRLGASRHVISATWTKRAAFLEYCGKSAAQQMLETRIPPAKPKKSRSKAKAVFRESLVTDLAAYILATSYSENLSSIERALQVKDVPDRILAVERVKGEQLKLRLNPADKAVFSAAATHLYKPEY